MSELRGSRTHDNLLRVLSRESSAQRRLTFFARIAEIEGFPEIAAVFGELAESQCCLADGNLDYLRMAGDPASGLPIGQTTLNRDALIASASEAAETLYPQMALTARREGFPAIATWLETLVHAKRMQAERVREMTVERSG